MKVFASPNTEIMLGGAILWEISWQRKGEDMFSQLVQLPPKGWLDPDLVDVLPKDVIEALIKKYNFNEK
tara:strand:+ start:153 stop:359 length:207 start_codon:yes stop_codon:yes gene_type:complete